MTDPDAAARPTPHALTDIGSVQPVRIWKEVTARIVQSTLITMAVVDIPPGGEVPAHRHENEQVGLCLTGSLTFTVGNETRVCGPGGAWRILANVPHEVVAGPEGAVVVEVFSPVRSDWYGATPEPDAPLRWPPAP